MRVRVTARVRVRVRVRGSISYLVRVRVRMRVRIRVREMYSLYLPEVSRVSRLYLVPVAALEVEEAAAEQGQVGQPQQAA